MKSKPRKRLKLAVLASKDANWRPLFSDYINMAQLLLDSSNMFIDWSPGEPALVDWYGPVYASAGDAARIRSIAQESYPALVSGNVLSVFFVNLTDKEVSWGNPGVTVDVNNPANQENFCWQYPWILIDCMRSPPDFRETLIHEIIHAADLKIHHSGNERSVFYKSVGRYSSPALSGITTKIIEDIYLDVLRKSFFASSS